MVAMVVPNSNTVVGSGTGSRSDRAVIVKSTPTSGSDPENTICGSPVSGIKVVTTPAGALKAASVSDSKETWYAPVSMVPDTKARALMRSLMAPEPCSVSPIERSGTLVAVAVPTVTVADSEPTEVVKDPRPEVSSRIVEPSDNSMKEMDAALAGAV
jgi:hypothetical protein